MEAPQLLEEPEKLTLDEVKPNTEAAIRIEHLQPPDEPNKLKLDKAAPRTESETEAGTKPKMMPPFGTPHRQD